MWDMKLDCGQPAYWGCLQVSCTDSKAQGPSPQRSEGNVIPCRNRSMSCADAMSPFIHQVVGQEEFCLSMGTFSFQGATGAAAQQDRALPEGCLWQLLHNSSENHQLFGTVHLIMLKWSCNGIPRQLSHCHGLDLSLSHPSSGFPKEVQLFSSLKCVESPGLNGREGELTSSTFPLFANGLCLKAVQEQGGNFVTP